MELKISLSKLKETILSLPDSKVIVYTYGVWDLLHPGHIKLLKRAKALGDFLIVGVVSDKPVKELKGDDRPTQSEEDRLIIVSNLRMVDAAIIQKLYDPAKEMEAISKLDILVKGDDWDYIPGQEVIEKMGGNLVKLKYSSSYSTSSLVSKIKKFPAQESAKK